MTQSNPNFYALFIAEVTQELDGKTFKFERFFKGSNTGSSFKNCCAFIFYVYSDLLLYTKT